MSRNGGYMCTNRLNRAIKSIEMASGWKISAHNFGMDFNVEREREREREKICICQQQNIINGY